MKKKTAVITEADWRSALSEEIQEAQRPSPPPEGFLSLSQWIDVLKRSENNVRKTISTLVKLGKLKKVMLRSVNSAGVLIPRPFWGPVKMVNGKPRIGNL